MNGDIHYPIIELSPEDRRDRERVNEAVCRYQSQVRSIGNIEEQNVKLNN
jgi:hypothetical protein